MNDAARDHVQNVVDQFTKQAVHFAKLPGHEAATQLLVQMAGVWPADEVLDVACGAGAVACAAAQVARRVTGIDLTPAMIEQARAQGSLQKLTNVCWQVGDVHHLPFANDRFGVVMTRYSFHHFQEPAEVLAEMVRVCQPSGRIVVADLVLPPEKVAAYDRMEKLRDPSHVHVLTEPDLRGLFAGAGLVDVRWAGYLFELELGQLLEASFPVPGGAERVRALFVADVGVDELGIGVHRSGDSIRFAYPIAIAVGTKP
jgi:ubiquinone/menaquinone biosynthesis C-methylase UbiE